MIFYSPDFDLVTIRIARTMSELYVEAKEQDEIVNMKRLQEEWGNLPPKLAEQLEYELASVLDDALEEMFIEEVPPDKKKSIDFHGTSSPHPGGLSYKMQNGDIISSLSWSRYSIA